MMDWLLVVLVVIVIVFLGCSLWLALSLVHPHMHSPEETYRRELGLRHFVENEFESLHKEEIRISSPFGYELFGLFFPVEHPRGVVLIAHGFTYGLYGSIKFLPVFLRRNWNVLLMDLRHHGRSGGATVTFGLCEKKDVAAWVEWARQRFGRQTNIGTLGESLGAAVMLQFAAIEPNLAFTVADCPFSDMRQLVSKVLGQNMHIPTFPVVNLADLWCRALAGMSFASASPNRCMAHIQTPVLLVHGVNDRMIPAQMSRDLYDLKTQGVRLLYIAPNADHAEAYWNNREEYELRVQDLLDAAGV